MVYFISQVLNSDLIPGNPMARQSGYDQSFANCNPWPILLYIQMMKKKGIQDVNVVVFRFATLCLEDDTKRLLWMTVPSISTRTFRLLRYGQYHCNSIILCFDVPKINHNVKKNKISSQSAFAFDVDVPNLSLRRCYLQPICSMYGIFSIIDPNKITQF